MNTRRIALLSVLVLSGAVTAPLYGQGGMMWGPVAGINLANFSGSDAGDASSHTGFLLGAQVQTIGAGAISFRSGLLYSMRGAEQSGLTLKMNYLEVPLLALYRIAMANSQVRPYVMGGGQVGFNVSCSFSGSGSSVACDDQTIGFEAATIDFGLALGGGVALPAGAGQIMIDARYLIGLQNVEKNSTLKNTGITLSVGYMMRRGR